MPNFDMEKENVKILKAKLFNPDVTNVWPNKLLIDQNMRSSTIVMYIHRPKTTKF